MTAPTIEQAPWWAWAWPIVGAVAMIATVTGIVGAAPASVVGAIVIAVVFAAVYHVEVVAHRVGEPFGMLSVTQLLFSAIVSLALYGAFVFVQTIRHRDYFLPPEHGNEDAHAATPTNRAMPVSLGLLLVSLVAVVGLAKALSPTLEGLVIRAGAPKAVVGIIIAALVLLPKASRLIAPRALIACRRA